MEENEEFNYYFIVKFKSEDLTIHLEKDASILHLKRRICELTNIDIPGQKWMGVKYKPGHVDDSSSLDLLQCQKKQGKYGVFMLTGVPSSQIIVMPEIIEDTVIDDLEWDYWPCQEEIVDMKERRAKLEQVVSLANINLMHEFDPTKKLIVLDLDQTLFDFGARREVGVQYTVRPGLTEFLATCWKYYNIVIWSATAWNWVEIKLTELGLLANDSFKFSFVLDKTTMINVKSVRSKKLTTHSVKPLELIWRKFPCFNEKNTIHVDDLSRNFVMNLKNGIKIKAYRYSQQAYREDRELYHCAKYITKIASLEDFTQKDHKNWRDEAKDL